MALTPEQTQIIKATAPVLQEHGLTITTHFYNTLLAEVPCLRTVFNHAHQATGHQARALADALFAYASNIDNLAALGPFVEHVCQKHVSLFVRPEQYDVVGTYLLRSLSEVLGEAATPPILDAWAAAYKQLADIMIGREKELYAAQDGWTDWQPLVVAKKHTEAHDITSFYLQPRDGSPLPPYRPGQYISVRTHVPRLGHAQARQYSLSDAPGRGHFRISVRREPGPARPRPGGCPVARPGAVSGALHDDVRVGDALLVSHPAGDFFLPAAPPPPPPAVGVRSVVLISAGVGLTPLLAMLNAMAADAAPRRISWIHGAREAGAQAFAEDVRRLEAAEPQLRAIVFHSNPSEEHVEGVGYQHKGRVDLGKLHAERDLFIQDRRAEYFVCGPETFMKEMQKGLMQKGVDVEIKMEVFTTGSI